MSHSRGKIFLLCRSSRPVLGLTQPWNKEGKPLGFVYISYVKGRKGKR
jgi:hypothetical protein